MGFCLFELILSSFPVCFITSLVGILAPFLGIYSEKRVLLEGDF